MGRPAEVRTKLKLDDETSAMLAKIKAGFGEVNQARDTAQTGFLDLAKQSAATALGMNLRPMIESTIRWGESFYSAAAAADASDSAIAALITTVQDLPWDQSKRQAAGFRQDLEDIGVASGVAEGGLEGAYQAMLELRGASNQGTAKAIGDVEKLASIAGELGKDPEALAREFSLMSEGIVRTKGQMFQLLQSTGIFGNNTKKAAAYWATLTEEQRITALDKGLERVAGHMAHAEPSAKQLMQSVENLYETTKERLGEPLMNELVPILKEVKEEWAGAIPDVEKFARSLSHDLGGAVHGIVDNAKDAFRYLVDHHEAIRDAVKEGYDKAKAVVEFILAHKEAIALAFGAKMAAPAVGQVAGVVGGIYARGAAEGPRGAPGDLAYDKAIGGAGALVATAGAAIAVGAAVEQFTKLVAELDDVNDAQTQFNKRLQELAQAGNVEELTRTMNSMEAVAQSAGTELDPAMLGLLTTMRELAMVHEHAKDVAEQELGAQIALGAKTAQNAATATGMSGDPGVTNAANLAQNSLAILVDAYNAATRNGNQAMAAMAAQTIAGTDILQKAFLASGMAVEGGLNAFADKVLAGGLPFLGIGTTLKQKAAAPASAGVVMTGGQTFKIQQDFRDGDPDRLLVVFQDDMRKIGERRLQSGSALPFGG